VQCARRASFGHNKGDLKKVGVLIDCKDMFHYFTLKARSVFRELLAKEGPKALFRGTVPILPTSSAFFFDVKLTNDMVINYFLSEGFIFKRVFV